MKVLFVASGNIALGQANNIVLSQGESLKSEGIELDYFLIKEKGFLGYFKSISLLKKALKAKKYSLIHAHYGLCGIVSFFAKGNTKLIVSFMGDDLLGSFSQSRKYSFKGKLISFINKFFAKYIYDHNIVKSENLEKTLWSKTVNSVIPNGVNFSKFYPGNKIEIRNELNLPLNNKIVLFASDPDRPEKNYALAESACNLLKEIDVKLKPVFNVSQDELHKYYIASDVVIMTSFHEGSPNVIKEALACNKPIVSTDVGDVRKNIANIKGCFLTSFEPKDVAANLKQALVIETTNGRASIDHLEASTIAKKIIVIYNSICSN